MAEDRKPRVRILVDGLVKAVLVVVTAENSESVELAYTILKKLGLQIEGPLRSGDQSAFLCLGSLAGSISVAFILSGFSVDRPSYGRFSMVEACLAELKRNVHKERGPVVHNLESSPFEDAISAMEAYLSLLKRKELTSEQLHDIKINIGIFANAMKNEGGGIHHTKTINLLMCEFDILLLASRILNLEFPSQSNASQSVGDGYRVEGGRNLEMPTSPDSLERSPFEVAILAMENYLSLLKRNELTFEQLNEIEVDIGLLATAMKDDGEGIHRPETINLLMKELCTLLNFRTRNLQCQSQSHASQSIRDGNREGGRNLAIESVLDDLSELTKRYYKGKGIELRKVLDIGCRIKKLGREKFCFPKKWASLMSQHGSTSSLVTNNGIPPINPVHALQRACKGTGSVWENIPLGDEIASTSAPFNINNYLHRSSVTDTDNGRLGAAGCSRWMAELKNVLSYCARIPNSLVKRRNGACSDLEAGVTRETATTLRERNYSQTALSTLAYALMGLTFSVPFAIMAISDGRMTKITEKLILTIALVILFLVTVTIGLIYLRGISGYRTAEVMFTTTLSLFLAMAVLSTLSALRLF